MAASLKPDVIIGTESWLIPDYKDNGIQNSEIFPDGYKDQPDIRGGGTFILIKDDLIGLRQTELETDCEIMGPSWSWLDADLCLYPPSIDSMKVTDTA